MVAAEDVRDADAFVVGSAVYMGHWLKEPTEFLENYPTLLRARAVWLFSSGPLPGSTRGEDPNDPLADALGPQAGPGSGGRKKVEELAASIGARDHRVFLGRYDPDDPPRSFPERVVRMLPMAKGVLPHGASRNWAGHRGMGLRDRCGGGVADRARLSRNAYRVMVGSDAKLMDRLYRLNPRRAAGFIAEPDRSRCWARDHRVES